jgi:hypothetical protein
VPQVVDVELPRHLRLPLLALPKDIAHLGDGTDAAARDNLDQDLVPERTENNVSDGFPSQHEVAAHRIGDPQDDSGQQQHAEQLGTA